MNLLLYMAPIAVILLLPATIFMEDNVVGVTIQLAKKDFTIVWLLLFNSCLAYFVNLTNFLVTKHTSALTLQVRNALLPINSSCHLLMLPNIRLLDNCLFLSNDYSLYSDSIQRLLTHKKSFRLCSRMGKPVYADFLEVLHWFQLQLAQDNL